MATGIKLTGPQLRALRILAVAGEARDDDHTDEAKPCIDQAVAEDLGRLYLADPDVRAHTIWWRIRSKGRQVLAEHEAGGSDG